MECKTVSLNERQVRFIDSRSRQFCFSKFVREKLDTLINLLAITHTGEPEVLARNDEMEDLRATIFEEFANSGLSILEEKLKGEVKYTQALLLMMKDSRSTEDDVESLVGIF